MLKEVDKRIEEKAVPEKIPIYQNFFKTGKGQYGEGDVFVGLTVPSCREIAKEFVDMDFGKVRKLLDDKVHEKRLIGLLILVEKYKKCKSEEERKEIYEFYMDNLDGVNNWDLVDLSADKIVGNWLIDKDKKVLYDLARSKNLWERRVAILSSFWFIKNNEFLDSLKISKILLYDEHDLIHKAVGWMLREIGRRDGKVLRNFLKKHYKNMPRTMLRYAIERFPEEERQSYLKGVA